MYLKQIKGNTKMLRDRNVFSVSLKYINCSIQKQCSLEKMEDIFIASNHKREMKSLSQIIQTNLNTTQNSMYQDMSQISTITKDIEKQTLGFSLNIDDQYKKNDSCLCSERSYNTSDSLTPEPNVFYSFNTLDTNIHSIKQTSQLYFDIYDLKSSQSQLTSLSMESIQYPNYQKNSYLELKVYNKQSQYSNLIKARVKRIVPLSDSFIFCIVKIWIQYKNCTRYIYRFFKLPLSLDSLSIQAIDKHIKLGIYRRRQKYCIDLKQKYQFQDKRTSIQSEVCEIEAMTVEKVAEENCIVELSIDRSQIKSAHNHIEVNNCLIQIQSQLMMIFTIWIANSDRHYLVPLNLQAETYSKESVGRIKQIIIQYVSSSFQFLYDKDMFIGYQLALKQQDAFIFLKDQQILSTITKECTNTFIFNAKKYFTPNKIIISALSSNIEGNMQKCQRSAFLHQEQTILIKNNEGIKQISLKQLTQEDYLMSNVLNYKNDRQLLLQINKIHEHKLSTNLISIAYNKQGQIKYLELHIKNVILYSFQAYPLQYSYCTAQQLYHLHSESTDIYIFDSINNSYKILYINKIYKQQYTFYTLTSKEASRTEMLVVNDIRILNTAVLTQLDVVVAIQEIREKEKKNYQNILYTFKDESNSSLKQGKEMYKTNRKINGNKDLYLNTKIPHINKCKEKYNFIKQQQTRHEKDEILVERESIIVVSQNKKIIYIKQRIRQRVKIKQNNLVRFRASRQNSQRKDQSLNEAKLKRNCYYFITQQIQQNLFQIVELQHPSFRSNIIILWIDDHPQHNIKLIQQIMKQGNRLKLVIEFNKVLSTQMAIAWVKLFYPYFKWVNPNCIVKLITDMIRKENNKAGAQVIQEIIKLNTNIEFAIYTEDQWSARNILYQHKQLSSTKIFLTIERFQIFQWCISCLENESPLLNIFMGKSIKKGKNGKELRSGNYRKVVLI